MQLSALELAVRWRAVAIIEALLHDESLDRFGFAKFDAWQPDGPSSDQPEGWGDMGDPGGYAWLYVWKGQTLFCGAATHRKVYSKGPEAEKAARAALRSSHPSLFRKILPRHPKSLGWTFAYHAETPHSEWSDLIGFGASAAKFKDCEILYGRPTIVPPWFRAQFEYEGGTEPVEAVLKGEPLTRELVKHISPACTFKRAVSIARRMGYPIADDLWRRR
jgi:hypothetical protein